MCCIRKPPVYPRWNSPALFSMPVGDTMPHFDEAGGGHLLQEGSSPLQLYVPSLNGKDFLSSSYLSSVRPPFSLCHGTTTLGFVFQDGVIAAADSRASCSGLIACPAVQKIMPVHSHLVVTTSGSGADCMLWQRILARECRLYHLRNHRRLSVGGAAKLLAYMLHPFKGTDLCVALTLCGWDEPDHDLALPETDKLVFPPLTSSSSLLSQVVPGSVLWWNLDQLGFCFSPLILIFMTDALCWTVGCGGGSACTRPSRLPWKAVNSATYRDTYSGNFSNFRLWREIAKENVLHEKNMKSNKKILLLKILARFCIQSYTSYLVILECLVATLHATLYICIQLFITCVLSCHCHSVAL
uniref:Proteasome subunit beta n=1 Tax=Paramormyrops kingsleyae TaxID=1676925 RepID=A0A3B3RI08_9TELE